MKRIRFGTLFVVTAACVGLAPSVLAQEPTPPQESAPADETQPAAEASPAAAPTEEAVAPIAEAEPAPAAEPEASGIEEITVTAQRREQNLQDVPISISAVTAESLQAMGVDGTEDLAAASPGLILTRQFGGATPYIRGVGTPSALGGNESAVALYIDGIYVPQLTALTFSFNNIERVEVLKGPQGTLFGRNATGGLIQVVTREPTSSPTLITGLSYDDYQTAEATLYVSNGLTENISGDFAVFYADQGEGYGTNKFNGDEIYAREELGLRASVSLKGTSATRARLSFDYTDIDSSLGVARQADRGALTIGGQGPEPDYWDINSNYDPLFTMEGFGSSLKVSHDFESVQLVSLTGYREGDSVFLIDQDATPAPLVDAIVKDDSTTITQELQLQSTASGPLNWIVGLYYYDFDVDYSVRTEGGALAPLGGLQIVESTMDTTSLAAYAQATYALTETTNLTLGIRYTADEREFEGTFTRPNATAPVPAFAVGTAPDEQTQEEPTWRLALDHKFNDDVLGYVSYNRGFKSGVYTMINPNDDPVDSEVVDAYEVGLKTDLLERRVRLNTSVFYYDYEDLQVQTIEQGNIRLNNAAKARLSGAEIELTALPTDQLEINVGLALLDSEYTDFPNGDSTAPNPAGGNFSCRTGQAVATPSCPESVRPTLSAQTADGKDVARAPDFTGSLSGRYGIPIAAGEVGLSASAVYNGGFYWEPDNRAEQDAYTLFNAQVDWRSPSERYRVYVFGKNLGDEEYSQFLSGGSFGDIVSAAPPRTFGLGGELRFE
ncbi:MAG: TonB-dependent receptor [Panacagrimonas sp.]